MLAVLINVGCGNKPVTETDAILLKDSFWVADSETMKYLNDAISRKDSDYMKQLMFEGKIFFVDKDTKIISSGTAAGKNNVLIRFKEGRYTNKTGCTHAFNVIEEDKYLHEKHSKLREYLKK